MEYWEKYVADLKMVTIYNASERALAQAMVWNHMAELYRDQAAELADGDSPFGLTSFLSPRPGTDSAAVKRARKSVLTCLEKSLECAPGYLPTYQLLVEVHRGWDDTVNLEAAARRLLVQFPDDLETLELLAKLHVHKNEPALALPLVQKARTLKPLDDTLRDLEWSIRVGLARTHALAKKWDEGREEFAAAEQLMPEHRDTYFYLARKVVFEAKAGDRERSDEYLAQAQASLKDPTPLWLALLIESIRHRMPKATQKSYAGLWELGLKNKCQSETAGEMASHHARVLEFGS